MEGTGIQPVMSMNPYGNDGGFFGGEGLWLFAILALMWGGNGFFGNRGADGRVATVEDVNNSANFTRLESQVASNGSAIRQEAEYIVNGISALGYQNARDFGTLSSQLSNCCCENLRANDQTRFDMANYTSAINANTTAGIQKVLDKLSEDKISALQGRINQLELQNAVAGVVRYPSAMTYSYNANPFCAGACGCNGNY